jgi:hypothetical protein
VFVRKNVAIETAEERIFLPDMADRQVIGVGKYEGRHATLLQARLQSDHRGNWFEDVAEDEREFFATAAKSRGPGNFTIKLLLAHEAGFVAEEQGRVVDQFVHLLRCGFAPRCKLA